ncbi:MAG: YciI family protein [Gordonia sp. (in: high G+C Gram-positive bacteria)]|uniref:YciI family protein n=1 Tax=Gordonia sp. (in: high G+C Gram-positive bacteria) TaxID=84139 RepID=UPI003BB7E4DD
MPNYAVEYTYHPDRATLRDEHRPAHRRWLGDGHAVGRILLVGPYSDGSGALLMVHADDERAAAELLSHDPFALVGAIDATTVKEWTNVYGPFAG